MSLQVGVIRRQPIGLVERIDDIFAAGVTKLRVTDKPGVEVRLEHPDLPGVFIVPVEEWVLAAASTDTLGNYIYDRLVAALAAERNVPYAD